jgi:hypothetical protein
MFGRSLIRCPAVKIRVWVTQLAVNRSRGGCRPHGLVPIKIYLGCPAQCRPAFSKLPLHHTASSSPPLCGCSCASLPPTSPLSSVAYCILCPEHSPQPCLFGISVTVLSRASRTDIAWACFWPRSTTRLFPTGWHVTDYIPSDLSQGINLYQGLYKHYALLSYVSSRKRLSDVFLGQPTKSREAHISAERKSEKFCRCRHCDFD